MYFNLIVLAIIGLIVVATIKRNLVEGYRFRKSRNRIIRDLKRIVRNNSNTIRNKERQLQDANEKNDKLTTQVETVSNNNKELNEQLDELSDELVTKSSYSNTR